MHMILSVGGLITTPWLFFFLFFSTKSRCVRLTQWLCRTMWANLKQQYYACRENMISLSNIWLRTWEGPPQACKHCEDIGNNFISRNIYGAKKCIFICVLHWWVWIWFLKILINGISHFLQAVKCLKSNFEFSHWSYCLATSKSETNVGTLRSWKMTKACASHQTCTSTMKQKTPSLAFCRIVSVELKVVLFLHACK